MLRTTKVTRACACAHVCVCETRETLQTLSRATAEDEAGEGVAGPWHGPGLEKHPWEPRHRLGDPVSWLAIPHRTDAPAPPRAGLPPPLPAWGVQPALRTFPGPRVFPPVREVTTL